MSAVVKRYYRLMAAVMIMAILVVVLAPSGCGRKTLSQRVDKSSEGTWPKIDELIYPTLGYPQIVKVGGDFLLEFDFTRDMPGARQPTQLKSWQVSVSSSNSFAPYTAQLEVEGADFGRSAHWVEGSGREVYEVWRVRVRVPQDIPPDLYDLEVQVEADGEEILDSQPHCLSVATEIKSEYEVVQFTDVHVVDVDYPGYSPHDRDIHEAYYLRKAIQQINLIHPDFAVFTGDLVFGQRYMPEDWPPGGGRGGSTEYDYEYPWAYREMLALEVPCFCIPGNHDTYYDRVKDGVKWWTESLGPLYYSFDYGNHHYIMIDTSDWTLEDRALDRGPYYEWAHILEPKKWKGQVRGGGDLFGDEHVPPPQRYEGQLAWIRDDLSAHRGAELRLAFSHHDPAQQSSWDDDYFGTYHLGGKGEGRRALLKLLADNRVNLYMSGHHHHDLVTSIPWSGGGGFTHYVNTTCLEPEAGMGTFYPGYRLVEISGGQVTSWNYLKPPYSLPYYRGVSPGQTINLDALRDPAIDCELSNGGVWGRGDMEVSCRVTNSLEKDFRGAYLEFYLPYQEPGVYQVSGATSYTFSRIPARPEWVQFSIYFDLPSGKEVEVRVSTL